ncbi:MAG: HD domain-containing protein [Gemmatimonadaceae bacterium]
MNELDGILDFLRSAERLKTTVRTAHTSTGDRESVAEHTWRLCLMAMVMQPNFPDVDFTRLVRMCIVHDLGEAISGDVSAPEQARLVAADPSSAKAEQERKDLLTMLAPLPAPLRDEIAGLWDEYEAGITSEARLAKALDKLETILQHTQGLNPPGFDYRFNLGYGRRYTDGDPLLMQLREALDRETERRATESS